MDYIFDREINILKVNAIVTVYPETTAPKHRNRKFHGIVFYLEGFSTINFIDGPTFNIKKGDIAYLPQYSNYDVNILTSGICIAINFNISETGYFEPFLTAAKPVERAVSLFQSADSIWNSKKSGYILKTTSILYDILYLTYRSINSAYKQGTQKTTDKLSKAIEYMENNYYKEQIRVSKLAELSDMSVEYFRRQFHILYGIPPLKYINNLKITRSMELLETDIYPIKEIAFMCGYEDESYFSREFKKLSGCTPSEYKLRGK